MQFQRTNPSWFYGVLRLISDEGNWELGLHLGADGARLRMGRTSRPPKVLDICLGRDATVYAPVTLAVLHRLKALPETSSEKEIDQVFPWAGDRPDLNLHLDLLLNNSECDSCPCQA